MWAGLIGEELYFAVRPFLAPLGNRLPAWGLNDCHMPIPKVFINPNGFKKKNVSIAAKIGNDAELVRFQGLPFHFSRVQIKSCGLWFSQTPNRRCDMRRSLQFLFGVSIALYLVGSPLAYAWHRHTTVRRFHVVQEGVLYRSGQISLDNLQRIVREYRIKTIITLRGPLNPGDAPPDLDEEAYCTSEEIHFFRIPLKSIDEEGGAVPSELKVRKFLDIVNNSANHPVLVRCLAGKHRTGVMCAIFRMERNHWTNKQAIEEMQLLGHDRLEEQADLREYLMRYQPTWLRDIKAGK